MYDYLGKRWKSVSARFWMSCSRAVETMIECREFIVSPVCYLFLNPSILAVCYSPALSPCSPFSGAGGLSS